MEKGETISRNTLYYGVDLSIYHEFHTSIVDYGFGAEMGSMLGSTKSLGVHGNWSYRFSETYLPSLGLSLDAEYGDYIFFSTGSTDFPQWSPGIYAGLSLKPLRFIRDAYILSFFDVEYLMGINISSNMRWKFSLFNISSYYTTAEDSLEKSNLSVEFTAGLNSFLLDDTWSDVSQLPDLGVTLLYRSWELGINYQSLTFTEYGSSYWEDGTSHDGFRLSGNISYVVRGEHWQPSIGLGYLYSSNSYGTEVTTHGTCGIVKPLKYFTGKGVDGFIISFLEMKLSPLLANKSVSLTQPGNFLLQISPIVIGYRKGL